MSDPHMKQFALEIARAVGRELLADLASNPPTPKSWLRPNEAAIYTGVAERTLENMRRERRGPRYSRLGHSLVRYSVADLDEWLRSGRGE